MRVKDIWKELNRERDIYELGSVLTDNVLEKVSTAILLVLVIMPIIIGITNIFNEKELYWLYNWYQFNLSIGLLGIVVGMVLILRYCLNKSRKSLKQIIIENKISFLLLLMFIWSIISFIFSTNHKISFSGDFYRREGLLCYIGYVGIFILARRIRNNNKQRIVLEVMIATSALMALICFINNQFIMDSLRLTVSSGLFYNSNHYGYYLVLCIMISQILISTYNNKYLLLLYVFELAILINALINCRSMGPLLAVVIATIAYAIIVIIKDKKVFKQTVLIIIICLFSGSLSMIGSWDIYDDVNTMINDAKTITTSNIDSNEELVNFDSIGSARGKLWRYGIEFVKERPLTGYGPDNLGESYRLVGCQNDRAHNELIQFAASLGLPALIFYLGALSILLFKFFKNFKSLNLFQLGLYSSLGAYLISSFFGNTAFYTTPFFILILSTLINNTDYYNEKHDNNITF